MATKRINIVSALDLCSCISSFYHVHSPRYLTKTPCCSYISLESYNTWTIASIKAQGPLQLMASSFLLPYLGSNGEEGKGKRLPLACCLLWSWRSPLWSPQMMRFCDIHCLSYLNLGTKIMQALLLQPSAACTSGRVLSGHLAKMVSQSPPQSDPV